MYDYNCISKCNLINNLIQIIWCDWRCNWHLLWHYNWNGLWHGLIQLRKEGTNEILNYEVSGDKIQSVFMLPGYTHNIINLSDSDDLITVMYCNEIFNPESPDTYFEEV